jgi:DNA-binding NtrC family response regulator
VIERAALLCRGHTIRLEDLGSSLGVAARQAAEPAGGPGGLPSLNLDALERLAIEEALERTGWHQGKAAGLLGISDRTLNRKMRSFGLRRG